MHHQQFSLAVTWAETLLQGRLIRDYGGRPKAVPNRLRAPRPTSGRRLRPNRCGGMIWRSPEKAACGEGISDKIGDGIRVGLGC